MSRKAALVFDLDNTLLGRTKSVSRANSAALDMAADAGFTLVIATSRPIRSIRQFLPPDLLARCITISLNGAAVWYPGADRARLFGSIGTVLPRLLDALAGIPHFHSYSLETDGHHFAVSHPLPADRLWSVHAATPEMVIPREHIDPLQVSKVAVDGHGHVFRDPPLPGDDFPALRVIPADGHTFLNIVAADVDKAPTLDVVARELGLDLGASVAFGDDLPDLGMLARVGTAVAMGNGHDAVKAVADHVIGDCDGDAIADWIQRNLLT